MKPPQISRFWHRARSRSPTGLTWLWSTDVISGVFNCVLASQHPSNESQWVMTNAALWRGFIYGSSEVLMQTKKKHSTSSFRLVLFELLWMVPQNLKLHPHSHQHQRQAKLSVVGVQCETLNQRAAGWRWLKPAKSSLHLDSRLNNRAREWIFVPTTGVHWYFYVMFWLKNCLYLETFESSIWFWYFTPIGTRLDQIRVKLVYKLEVYLCILTQNFILFGEYNDTPCPRHRENGILNKRNKLESWRIGS